jgi:hypothetical protein
MGIDNLRKSTAQPEPEPTEECPYCGNMFKSVSRHLPYCPQNPDKKKDIQKIDVDLQKIKRLWNKMRDSIRNRWESAHSTGWVALLDEFESEIEKIK